MEIVLVFVTVPIGWEYRNTCNIKHTVYMNIEDSYFKNFWKVYPIPAIGKVSAPWRRINENFLLYYNSHGISEPVSPEFSL